MDENDSVEIPQAILQKFEEYCRENKITGKEKEEKFKQLREWMHRYVFEPGEAIGIIAAQSISEPATQMSTSPYEKVILKRNGVINTIEIGKFTDAIVEELGKTIGEWDVSDISSAGVYVPSINEEEKIEWKKVLAVSRHKSPKKLLKIATFSGRQIVATDSHSFITRRNNKIIPIAGSDLTMNDRIPVLKYLPENCIETVNVKNHITSPLKERSGFLYSTWKSKPIPAKINLDYCFGWFIGAYLSEGSCNGNQITISNIDESFILNGKIFAEKIGIDFKDRFYDGEFGDGRSLTINSAILSKFMISTCGAGSSKKHVPYFAYSAKEEFVSGLLRGYFDGDGNVHPERNLIRVSSNSKELLDGICLLLARFGIFAYKKQNKHQFGLLIPYKYAPIFLEKIGSDIARKADGLEKMAENAKDYWNKKSQDFTDMISGLDDVLYRVAKKLKYPTRYVNNFTKRQKIGRTALYRYMSLFEKIAAEKNVDISHEIKLMRRMFSSDVVWDRITSIEYIRPDFDYVYDLTVEGTETFTTFDGIVTHNTMRSYTLASQSDRLSKVTQGLPRLIEIFDARKTYEKNMLIYLKEQYNTKEKAREIANRIRSMKVADITRSHSIDLVEMRIELELEREGDKEKVKKIVSKYLKEAEISFRENKVFIKPKKEEMHNLRKIRNKLLRFHVDGVKGVENVVVIKEDEDWVIQSQGTNLKKVLKMGEVDVSRTRTNDVYQVYEILGVEAARNIILKEAKETLDEQGLDVDIRHLMLLADTMTFDGEVKAIGRYGVSGKKASVLAKANFEETKKHLINASFYGESDTLDGVIENILLGQIAPIGTGMVELTIDMEKMRAALKAKE
ncbi:MAG: DNA-directed RNA polymerase subunit A'' [Candidatus Aenigmarchaeota archaeon]|nr:DNA-directed RNA polymerase subunit A'' [Candidatus Aenigmarchaeota archaeon]